MTAIVHRTLRTLCTLINAGWYLKWVVELGGVLLRGCECCSQHVRLYSRDTTLLHTLLRRCNVYFMLESMICGRGTCVNQSDNHA